ncbi:Acyl-CoA Delta(11) desaturase [Frankliniella fusca]|uniref:Acyl-CoA Delta(11) desaturase n=1 Tax=Frankliniella fusca TaxID=407009 RepID=A0AAE1L6G8_9NEOP|nr:Acyl-CoA Delta(11) desaturase [Frankliniella fusca]
MAPHIEVSDYRSGVLFETEDTPDYVETLKKDAQRKKPHLPIVWFNVFWFCVLHAMAAYGFYLALTTAKIQTSIFAFCVYYFSGLGVSAGVHRLWSHKSYKAKLPLRILLTFCNSIAYHNSIWEWARDHRVHHKFTETDADPVNAARGFFFSHVGWLMMKKHPDVRRIGKTVDMSDIEADPCVAFQKKYYVPLVIVCCWTLPTVIPALWGESYWNAFFVSGVLRYTLGIHGVGLVNSLAHYYGARPYDKSIMACENVLVSMAALGEGSHNYHHVFPWDYKTDEVGGYATNWTCAFLHLMEKIGWAYDFKTVNKEMIKARAVRTGDGTHPVWGWDDKDMTEEDRELAKVK